MKTTDRFRKNQFPKLIGWNQSVSTWRNSTYSYGFPKAERFQKINTNGGGIAELQQKIFRNKSQSNQKNRHKTNKQEEINDDKKVIIGQLPSTLCTKSCSLGFGQKQYIPQYQLRKMIENPSPAHYQNDININHIQNIVIFQNNRFGSPTNSSDIPGPGQYELREIIGKNKRKATLKFRTDIALQQQSQTPAANQYNPKITLINQNRYKSISFGQGQKTDFSKLQDLSVPGPGNYEIISPFDRYNNKNRKIIKQACLTTKGKDMFERSQFSYYSTPKEAMQYLREKCLQN